MTFFFVFTNLSQISVFDMIYCTRWRHRRCHCVLTNKQNVFKEYKVLIEIFMVEKEHGAKW